MNLSTKGVDHKSTGIVAEKTRVRLGRTDGERQALAEIGVRLGEKDIDYLMGRC